MIYIIKVWKFIKGYVIIKISGFNINKLINKSAVNNIIIQNLQNHNNGKYYSGYVHISQLDMLTSLAEKNSCHIEQLSKSIKDIISANLKYKLIYILGIIFFISFINICSGMVWIIDIQGNENLSTNSLLKFCDDNNLYVGCLLSSVDGKMLSENLKNKYNNVSWVNFSTEGTCVHIKLAEGTEKSTQDKLNKPCDIISDTDGIISEIVTDNGTPMVKKNDVISKGDILISGILKNSGAEEIIINDLVHAKGNIKAFVTKNYKLTTPLIQKEKVYTGKEQNRYRIKLWKLDFSDKNKINYVNYDYTKNIKQVKLSEKIPLPITFYKYNYKEYLYRDNIIDVDTAKDISNKKIIEYIIENYPVSADILKCNIKYYQKNNCLEVSADITSEESIGIEHSIEQQPGGNSTDDTTKASNTQ